MERLIVLDTETTGISPAEGHRILEIGCVELVNLCKAERKQWYINPQMDIPEEVVKIHGITNEKVANCPIFSEIALDFLAFIKNDPLVIHNASFDLGFLNAELVRSKRKALSSDQVIDTLSMARRKFPNSPVNLNALCRRFKIDLSQRDLHGALLDADLLADVYIELKGGNQFSLQLEESRHCHDETTTEVDESSPRVLLTEKPTTRRSWPITASEEEKHRELLAYIQKKSNTIKWQEPLV